MTRFGDELRQERVARGMGIEEICAATKISAQNVNALEAGELSQLPGGVFRRGIVRSYLGALGLEEKAWMERFEVSCHEAGVKVEDEHDWVQFAENVKKNRAAAGPRMGWRWVGVAVLWASLGLMAWLAWHVVRERGAALRLRGSAAKSVERPWSPG